MEGLLEQEEAGEAVDDLLKPISRMYLVQYVLQDQRGSL